MQYLRHRKYTVTSKYFHKNTHKSVFPLHLCRPVKVRRQFLCRGLPAPFSQVRISPLQDPQRFLDSSSALWHTGRRQRCFGPSVTIGGKAGWIGQIAVVDLTVNGDVGISIRFDLGIGFPPDLLNCLPQRVLAISAALWHTVFRKFFSEEEFPKGSFVSVSLAPGAGPGSAFETGSSFIAVY